MRSLSLIVCAQYYIFRCCWFAGGIIAALGCLLVGGGGLAPRGLLKFGIHAEARKQQSLLSFITTDCTLYVSLPANNIKTTNMGELAIDFGMINADNVEQVRVYQSLCMMIYVCIKS